MMGVDLAVMFYCQQMEMVMISFRIDIARENDSETPVQQAFLLQQRLTEVNHPDHTLITYPNLGHQFYPSSQWITGVGPFEPYVLADIYAWLETHSGLSYPYVATPTSTLGANTSSSSKR